MVSGLALAGMLCVTAAASAQQAPEQTPAAGGQAGTGQGQTGAGQGQAGTEQGQAAGQAPAAQQQDGFKFSSDAVAILWYIKPDKTADFESAWSTIKSRLSQSDKPDLKTIGDTLKIWKVDAPAGANGQPYITYVDPVVKTSTYNPMMLLFNSGAFTREEAQPLYDKLFASINNGQIIPMPLVAVQASAAAPAAAPSSMTPAPAPAPTTPGPQ
jgi:hypothetical protein